MPIVVAPTNPEAGNYQRLLFPNIRGENEEVLSLPKDPQQEVLDQELTNAKNTLGALMRIIGVVRDANQRVIGQIRESGGAQEKITNTFDDHMQDMRILQRLVKQESKPTAGRLVIYDPEGHVAINHCEYEVEGHELIGFVAASNKDVTSTPIRFLPEQIVGIVPRQEVEDE